MTIADLGMTLEEVRGQSLDLVAREGARMILEAALREVAKKLDSWCCGVRIWPEREQGGNTGTTGKDANTGREER